MDYLYWLAGMAAIIGENGRDGLQDFARVSPGHHKTEEAGTGQGCNCLSRWVIGPCAPDRGLQQQLEKRFWQRKKNGAGKVGLLWKRKIIRTMYTRLNKWRNKQQFNSDQKPNFY